MTRMVDRDKSLNNKHALSRIINDGQHDDNLMIEKLRGRVAVIGIGNVLRGDDGAGPALIKRIEGDDKFLSMKGKLLLMDVGEVPENYLGKIVKHKPDLIILVDAVDWGGVAGSVKIIEQENIINSGLSTHNASIELTMKYLSSESGSRIVLLGIQPETLKLGSGLSEPVKDALNRVREWLLKCMSLE